MDLVDTIEGPILVKQTLNTLANLTLSIQCDRPEAFLDVFDDQDLLNATLVLNAVLFPMAFRHHGGGPAIEALAEEIGKNLRQTILLATGVDMADAAKGGKQ